MNGGNMIVGTKEEYENNGFDLLRYTAAFSVMMLHYSSYCMILSRNLPAQASAVMSRVRHIALMFPGVVILFTMSGFLIAASFERAKTRKEFFLRRVLRIYPELWICTIINLAVVCILVPQMLDRRIRMCSFWKDWLEPIHIRLEVLPPSCWKTGRSYTRHLMSRNICGTGRRFCLISQSADPMAALCRYRSIIR